MGCAQALLDHGMPLGNMDGEYGDACDGVRGGRAEETRGIIRAMFLAKRSLSRRTLLRGSGSLIVLPLLDAMLPAQSAATTTPARLVCIEMVHGAAGSTNDGSAKHYWSPAQAGADFEFSYTLEPLKALRDTSRSCRTRMRARPRRRHPAKAERIIFDRARCI